jgi:PAS domain S-box-containing protein
MMSQDTRLRILIVDDDETDYFIISEHLKGIKNQSFVLDHCNTFARAAILIPKRLHDIYFIDYGLGIKTGLDLLRLAIGNHCEEPFILLTGRGNAEIDQEAMRIGAADYLVKAEITSENLDRSIRYALTRNNALKALRASEKKYKTIFETSYEALFLANAQFKIVDLNPAAETLLGHPRAQLMGMSLCTFLKDHQAGEEAVQKVLSGQPLQDFDIYIIDRAGDTKDCLLSITPFVTDELEAQYLCILHDITNLRRVEKATLKAEKLAATWQVTRTLAHEVRNPLSTIIMSVHQLESSKGDEIERPPFIEIIKRNSERINTLITQMLASSRHSEIQSEITTMQKIICRTVQLIQDRLALKNVQLQVDLPKESLFMKANEEKLELALMNILVNAIEAVQPTAGIISMKLSRNKNEVRITIADNGCGIPEKNISNIFEPYFTSKKGGMGIGLASTLSIVKAHLGEIEVNSEVGRGTCFTLTLPLVENHKRIASQIAL